ncbi:MAG: hypothetical protein Q7R49_04175 [Candidatus Daviesbacteria bacterium]|nr:hypothetical protein [Candidatus Daviesbacteria bacterium]
MIENEEYEREIMYFRFLGTEILNKKSEIDNVENRPVLKRAWQWFMDRNLVRERKFDSMSRPSTNISMLERVRLDDLARPTIFVRELLYKDGLSTMTIGFKVITRQEDEKLDILDLCLPKDNSVDRTEIYLGWDPFISPIPYSTLRRLSVSDDLVSKFLTPCLEAASGVLD